MYSKLELAQYEKAVADIQAITRIYEEAAMMRMNQIRVEIAKLDKFLTNLMTVYTQAKMDYERQSSKRKKLSQGGLKKPKSKTVLVFIASQKKLYGNLIINIYHNFIADVKKTGYDSVVIGAVGKLLIERERLNSQVIFFDLDDENPDPTTIRQIVNTLCQYEQVVVYYGEFVSVLNQLPKKSDISKIAPLDKSLQSDKKYLYEPEFGEIAAFCEKEKVAVLLQEKIFESQLARFGAKIKLVEVGQVAMKISEVIGNIDKSRLRVRKRISNKKQMEIFCGYNLWGQQ